jgi:hypothetical protein
MLLNLEKVTEKRIFYDDVGRSRNKGEGGGP